MLCELGYAATGSATYVLILVLMEYALRDQYVVLFLRQRTVLILVLMEYALRALSLLC